MQRLADKGVVDITLEALKAAGYLRGNRSRVKLLAGGELKTSVTVTVHAASASAKAALEKAGGTVTIAE